MPLASACDRTVVGSGGGQLGGCAGRKPGRPCRGCGATGLAGGAVLFQQFEAVNGPGALLAWHLALIRPAGGATGGGPT